MTTPCDSRHSPPTICTFYSTKTGHCPGITASDSRGFRLAESDSQACIVLSVRAPELRLVAFSFFLVCEGVQLLFCSVDGISMVGHAAGCAVCSSSSFSVCTSLTPLMLASVQWKLRVVAGTSSAARTLVALTAKGFLVG